MRFITLKGILVFCFVFCAAYMHANEAQAVRVSMKRVTFEGSKKAEVLTIINNTPKEQTYRLGWKRLRMDAKKSLRSIKKDEDSSDIMWAEDMVRFAPRRISVPAGASQQIRLLLRRKANMQDGEYRAHLWIVSEGRPPEFDANPNNDKQEIRLAVQPAITLPIFVRQGEPTVQASIENTSLSSTANGLDISLTLERSGDRSLYGDFDFVCTDSGKNVVLHQVRGVAVYTEIDRRFLNYTLPLSEETTTSCNTVTVIFRASPDDTQLKGAVMAEKVVTKQ